ncbi:hypothetical protein HHK36_005311 [Tetracentron sinense]|uniref:Proton pump-interactor 1 n=1 Tax=Tetracentron sinense TaxID=13715 RepID=A0A834ZV84_TETSI|nr:hypothetical protein HHK36_005311 [Tetracentron sinense]
MGVEVTQEPAKDGNKGDSAYLHEKDDGKQNQGLGFHEPFKFGTDEGDGNPKKILSFYFIKFPSFEDPNLKAKIEKAHKEIQNKTLAGFPITEALYYQRWNRQEVISQLSRQIKYDKQYRMILNKNWKGMEPLQQVILNKNRKEMEPLQQTLGKLRSANNASRVRGVSLCASEEELNDLIQSLHFRMQHECNNTLVEEKQLLREIKQLEGTREKVIASSAMKAKVERYYLQLMGVDLDGVKKRQLSLRAEIKHLEGELKVIDNNISSLQKGLTVVNQKKVKAYEGILELKNQHDEENSNYYQNRSLLNNARELAAKKDILTLEELSHTEVEKFMSLWSSSKAFRDDYEKRILSSLDSRHLSRDGRMRNPGEKPLVLETPTPTESDTVVKGHVKRKKEDSKPPPQHDIVPTPKVQKENKPTEAEPTIKGGDLEDKENISGFENPQKDSSTISGVDAAKLKELKREDEIAKAKLALERKKKLAEKAAAKAAIRAQMEAEKKLKEIIILISHSHRISQANLPFEHEKRAKKKASASLLPTNPEEQIEADKEVVEPEMADVNAPVQSKNKEQKENTIRYRNRSQGQDPLPKVILKWKKLTPYWVWAAPTALVVLMLVALGYYHLF